METLIAVPPGAAQGSLPGTIRTGVGIDRAGGRLPVTGGTLRRWLRDAYGLCMLLGAPREALLLAHAPAGTALARHLAGRARIATLAARPFICSRWSVGARLRRIIGHCAIVDALGHPFTISGAQFVEIIAFELDGRRCRLMLDKADWLACDGLLCVSLWVDCDRILAISFCLSDDGGLRTAYVGGIQGRRASEALDQNRALTKAAHGLRPRDLAFELFRMLLPRMGVVQLRCVADANRYQRTRRALLPGGADDKVRLDYDEIWASRGGVLGSDGFFLVPIQRQHRAIADIPARKRSMYARRYAFLDELNQAVEAALRADLAIEYHACSTGKS